MRQLNGGGQMFEVLLANNSSSPFPFFKLAKKNHTFKVDMLSFYNMKADELENAEEK